MSSKDADAGKKATVSLGSNQLAHLPVRSGTIGPDVIDVGRRGELLAADVQALLGAAAVEGALDHDRRRVDRRGLRDFQPPEREPSVDERASADRSRFLDAQRAVDVLVRERAFRQIEVADTEVLDAEEMELKPKRSVVFFWFSSHVSVSASPREM